MVGMKHEIPTKFKPSSRSMHKYRMEISKTTVIHPSLLSQTNPIVVYDDASQFLLFFSMGNICAKFYFLQIEFVITFVAIVVFFKY